jgi:hypothetical protein
MRETTETGTPEPGTEPFVPTVALDFDGVIHAYTRGWQDGTIYDPPMPGAIDGVRALLRTFNVVIFTTRNRYDVAHWMRKKMPETQFHTSAEDRTVFWRQRGAILVTNCKPGAKWYVDDRAVRFFSWDQTLHLIAMSQAADDHDASAARGDATEPVHEREALAVIADILAASSVKEAIGLSLGAGSMCWSEVPTGVFESGRASAIVDALYERVMHEHATTE